MNLLRPQKADFASLVRNFFETEGYFEKLNFFFLFSAAILSFDPIAQFYFAVFDLHLDYLHKV